MAMELEHNERIRSEAIEQAMAELLKMLKNPKLTPEQRCEAAKRLDAMSDSIIQAHAMFQRLDTTDKNERNLLGQLDKFRRDN